MHRWRVSKTLHLLPQHEQPLYRKFLFGTPRPYALTCQPLQDPSNYLASVWTMTPPPWVKSPWRTLSISVKGATRSVAGSDDIALCLDASNLTIGATVGVSVCTKTDIDQRFVWDKMQFRSVRSNGTLCVTNNCVGLDEKSPGYIRMRSGLTIQQCDQNDIKQSYSFAGANENELPRSWLQLQVGSYGYMGIVLSYGN
jgi:hypothetical protein